jgi:hypothetical protein
VNSISDMPPFVEVLVEKLNNITDAMRYNLCARKTSMLEVSQYYGIMIPKYTNLPTEQVLITPWIMCKVTNTT